MIAPPSHPKPGAVWRFPTNTYARSQHTRDVRWVDVLIPPGKGEFVFAALPELGIPDNASVIYVSGSRPSKAACLVDEGEYAQGGVL